MCINDDWGKPRCWKRKRLLVPLCAPRYQILLKREGKSTNGQSRNPVEIFLDCFLFGSRQKCQGDYKRNRHFQCCVERKLLMIWRKYLRGFVVHVFKFIWPSYKCPVCEPFVTRQITVRPRGASECLTNAFQLFLVVVSQNFYLYINNQFLAISCSSP